MSAVDETISLYNMMGWKKLFSRIRFWDAPFIEVEKLIPKSGTILDLGCGEGIFTNYLALSSSKRKIIGVELDKQRVREANRGLKNVKFEYGDATKYTISKIDTIVMFHLLHHLSSYKDQEDLIKKCVTKLPKKGKLIIIEVEPGFSFKYWLAYFTDHFLVPWIFEKRLYSLIYFRNRDEWRNLLETNGLSCKIISADKNKPFSHIIFNCQK